ncbi:uncharacterized protein LOC143863529 [Tasmannia lanceolata]|uniref:uncharacterized protein LOC143863529 n=1 Tax=Tasmannia lanceolata TaxID=3420 RepID=UPI0040631DF8
MEGEEEKSEKKRVLISLPLEKYPNFNLEKAVCSHGLFMMPPNLWISPTKTLQRPLRLSNPIKSVTVQISQHSSSSSSSSCIHIWVFGLHSLSHEDRQTIQSQVVRMLRLSDDDERKIREFHKVHVESKERGFGRVFRSPTLFEDMVKCILLCNCQWPRTLSMSRALCELQLELKGEPLGCATAEASSPNEGSTKAEDFLPKTPARRDVKRKRGQHNKISTNLASKFLENETDLTADKKVIVNCDPMPKHLQMKKLGPSVLSLVDEDAFSISASQLSEGGTAGPSHRIGNFPSPEELATLNEDHLMKRCGLGYRAKRILELAQNIVEGKIHLREHEEVCDEANPHHYNKLTAQLLGINGFGSFTCANVLMCMGFYQRIPADTETVRHLKKIHARRKCTIHTIQKDVEVVYGKYEPFQFLAYWSELWHSYEERFGKLSEMSQSGYQLITGNNMRKKVSTMS